MKFIKRNDKIIRQEEHEVSIEDINFDIKNLQKQIGSLQAMKYAMQNAKNE